MRYDVIYVKVKVTLEQATKAQRRSRDIAILFLNLLAPEFLHLNFSTPYM